jgi:hypothetical protein
MGAEERADAPGSCGVPVCGDDVDRRSAQASALRADGAAAGGWTSRGDEEAVRRVAGLLDLDDAVVEELIRIRPTAHAGFDRCFLVTLSRGRAARGLRVPADRRVVGDSDRVHAGSTTW